MRRIGLGFLTVLDATPPDSISIAAACGYDGVSLMLGKAFMPPPFDLGLPFQSIFDDANLRRETMVRARQTGVGLDQMEGFIFWSGVDLDRWRAALDITAEMGIPEVATFDIERDRARAADQRAALCAMAAERGLKVVLEFQAGSRVKSIAAAADMIAREAHPNLRILVDALHLHRGGETPDDVAKVPPAFIDCAQFCDGPRLSESPAAYTYEGLHERKCPGDGELPLIALARALPPGASIFLEVPQRAAREQGVSAKDRAQRAIDGVRRVLAAA
jgi:sugar phosphate isomerase/epimerase